MAVKTKNDKLSLTSMEMGLGTWAWGDRTLWNYGHGYTDQDIEEAFLVSQNAGITLYDTAEVYGSGRSEILLGGFLKQGGKPAFVATKFMPYPWRLRRKAIKKALIASLERLGIDKVDLYQIHWPFPPFPVEFWVEEMGKLVREGLVGQVGVSNFDKNQMQRAYNHLEKYKIALASNQVEYHLLNRTIEKNGVLELCKELDIRLIAYSPLAKGFLTGKYTQANPPAGIRGNGAVEKLKRIEPLLQLLTGIGKNHGDKTPSQVALNWIICKGALPIPGAKNGAQAQENVGALGWKLKKQEIVALDEMSDEVAK